MREESKPKKKKRIRKSQGFAWGLKLSRLLKIQTPMENSMFLMKWKISDEADLVPAKEAKVKCFHRLS